jgi:guanine nucleotide-binding protein subunit alpha
MAVREQKSHDQPPWPPVLHDDESEVDKKARLKIEAEAKRISELIDRQIEQDRQAKEKDPGGKILLLGAFISLLPTRIWPSSTLLL